MKDFPVRVDLLCRFRTAGKQKKTIEDLKKGRWILSLVHTEFFPKDVKFKNLGLSDC